ncbi:MAG: VWA domain-containing protein, partial [Gammaproteobacteria bacterium]|nr:VWA domain-containing protein [Gammaproteobacteria bacterium]
MHYSVFSLSADVLDKYTRNNRSAMLLFARIFCFFCLLGMSWGGIAAERKQDIRVLIDVSGSMKKTDPSNLRVPAMKLLNGLIPKGSHAGIWTFGRYVNMTVKWGKVDAGWRKLADLGAEEIHSNALFTNIEGALDRATKGWDKPDPSTQRNLILLTDGRVDISKHTEKNAKSRQAIFDKSITRLKNAGAGIQAVALSDDADEVLLRRLALETGGSFEVARTAGDLQKIFFKMFERAIQPDTVSIKDNQFKVDSSIKEMTLLIFRKPGSKSTRLFGPDGGRYSARKQGNSKWRSDEGYDLITIQNPARGLWSIDADIDPDNRLMVVTDLGLELAEQDVNVLPEREINIAAALYNKGKHISKNSFLRFVEFSIKHTDSNGVETENKLEHSKERKRKGEYLFEFSEGLEEGLHSIVVTADSRTFSRSKRIDLNVQWPVEVLIKPAEAAGNYELSIRAREEYIKSGSLKATVEIEGPDGKRYPLNLNNEELSWVAPVETVLDGIYKAHVAIEAVDQAGVPVSFDLGAFSMVGVYKVPSVESATPDTDTETQQGEIAGDIQN